MIYFMIDFENVGNQGLKGAEYLTIEDRVFIFYSRSCNKVERREWDQMLSSRSKLEICGLKAGGKNALDFYIASKVGEIYGAGYDGTVAVVSKDKGFQALKDYWWSCAKKPHSIVLKPNIEQSIVSSNENSVRRKEIINQLQLLGLETEYARHEERMRIHDLLEKEFKDTVYEDRLERIEEILERGKQRKVLYLDSLKSFGRKDGTVIYNKIKDSMAYGG